MKTHLSIFRPVLCGISSALALWAGGSSLNAQTPAPVCYFYHSDHLGSTSIITDVTGHRVDHYQYSFYGRTVAGGSGQTAMPLSDRFTDQVFDEDTGLYYYDSRYYDPELGNFIQPDSVVPEAGDPQSLDRYSYVRNDPLNKVDPSGHDDFQSGFTNGLIGTSGIEGVMRSFANSLGGLGGQGQNNNSFGGPGASGTVDYYTWRAPDDPKDNEYEGINIKMKMAGESSTFRHEWGVYADDPNVIISLGPPSAIDKKAWGDSPPGGYTFAPEYHKDGKYYVTIDLFSNADFSTLGHELQHLADRLTNLKVSDPLGIKVFNSQDDPAYTMSLVNHLQNPTNPNVPVKFNDQAFEIGGGGRKT